MDSLKTLRFLIVIVITLGAVSCSNEEEEFFYQRGSINGDYFDLKSVSIKSDYEPYDDSWGYAISVQTKSGKQDFDFICVVYDQSHWREGGRYPIGSLGADNRWLGHAIYTAKVGDEYRVESLITGGFNVWEIDEANNYIDFSFRGNTEDGDEIYLSYDGDFDRN